MRFVKISAVKITLYLQLPMKRCQFSIFFLPIWIKFGSEKCSVSFNLKISEVKAVVYFGAQTTFNPFFPHFCPIWVKFGTTALSFCDRAS
jgi:hypothetical protein